MLDSNDKVTVNGGKFTVNMNSLPKVYSPGNSLETTFTVLKEGAQDDEVVPPAASDNISKEGDDGPPGKHDPQGECACA